MNDKYTYEVTDTGKYFYENNVRIFPEQFWQIIKKLEYENKELKKELALSKPLYSRRQLEKENEKLKDALKNSYINEICENCKHGHYWISETFGYGLEGEFECLKKHFGNDHWKCDGLTECDEFELEIKGDVE